MNVEYRIVKSNSNPNEYNKYLGSFDNRCDAENAKTIDTFIQVAVFDSEDNIGYGLTLRGAKRNLRNKLKNK